MASLLARLFGLLALAGLLAAPASAQTFPDKRLTMIVPWPAGAGTDAMARLIAQKMSQSMGQPIVVENKTGANGMLGADAIAKAKPDGYTIGIATADTHAINPGLHASLPYDAARDFTPITLFAKQPLILVVHPSVPATSVAELIALAKARPGTLNYGSWGVGSTVHVTMELFRQKTGVDVVHVPYRGLAPALADFVSGKYELMFSGPSSMLPHIATGKLRGLASSTAERTQVFRDFPTLIEAGVPDFDVTTWFGIVGPAGIPPEIVARLNAEVLKALATQEVTEFVTGIVGQGPIGSTPEEFGTFQRAEMARWKDVVRAAGVRPEQ